MLPRLILLDADGVLWRGGEVIPAAPDFVRRCRAAGIRCVLITNNAGLSRAAYAAKCQTLGLAFEAEDIYSSAYLAGPYIAANHAGQRVLVVGSRDLHSGVAEHCAVAEADCEVVFAHDWLAERGLGEWLGAQEQLRGLDEARFDAVLMGIDVNASYAALALAGVACQRGARLIATNDDATFPFAGGMTLPGNGSFVGLVGEVAGVMPLLLGKPELHLLELIERETGVARADMAMVGDRYETDIVFAQRGGVPAFLVLTGVTTPAEAPADADGLSVVADLDAVAAALGLAP